MTHVETIAVLSGVLFLIGLLGRAYVPALAIDVLVLIRCLRDYRDAKGTRQMADLAQTLQLMNKRREQAVAARMQLRAKIRSILEARDEELEAALFMDIIPKRLDEVRGIGLELSSRILRDCFDGTMESLRHADVVDGVGQAKVTNIRDWVDRLDRDKESLLEETFRGKAEILGKYKGMVQEIEGDLTSLDGQVGEVEELSKILSEALRFLTRANRRHFWRAYRNRSRSAAFASDYIMGMFPEWESSRTTAADRKRDGGRGPTPMPSRLVGRYGIHELVLEYVLNADEDGRCLLTVWSGQGPSRRRERALPRAWTYGTVLERGDRRHVVPIENIRPLLIVRSQHPTPANDDALSFVPSPEALAYLRERVDVTQTDRSAQAKPLNPKALDQTRVSRDQDDAEQTDPGFQVSALFGAMARARHLLSDPSSVAFPNRSYDQFKTPIRKATRENQQALRPTRSPASGRAKQPQPVFFGLHWPPRSKDEAYVWAFLVHAGGWVLGWIIVIYLGLRILNWITNI